MTQNYSHSSKANYMASNKHNDDLTIREIEYSILIKDKDKGFHELHDILRSELTRFEDTRKKNEKTENPIRDFLKTNIERSIVIRDSTRVYFINYREQGSFTIQFTLLVITRYINYGTTRQALDYLIKDTIGDYFEELLERHLPVSVSVHSADNELYEIPSNRQDFNYTRPRQQRDYLSIILASFALLFTISLSLIWFLHKNQVTEIKKPSDEYRDKYFELLIEKQINEAFDKGKLNFILYKNLILASDSGANIKFKEKK
jgi:hypothetical protein